MNLPAFQKTYGKTRVLDFPGLQLEPGKIYAVIGANGSGKSTFAKILCGVIAADAPYKCTGTIGYLPQKSYAFHMNTKKNLLLGSRDPARAKALMADLQIDHLAHQRADKLSGGETARMALARLMMKRYDLVILDEPTAAMDMETTSLSEGRIAAYVRETGCTLILITHSLQQARRMAQEVLYFHKGKLLEHGPADTLLYDPACPETRQFLEFYGN